MAFFGVQKPVFTSESFTKMSFYGSEEVYWIWEFISRVSNFTGSLALELKPPFYVHSFKETPTFGTP